MSSSETQMRSVAKLAGFDAQLDEIRQDLGDLPDQVKAMEDAVRQKLASAEEIQKQLDELLDSRSKASITLQELRDREAKIADQQFNVRNNREFDAITHELEAIKTERNRINDEQRTSAVKEENLRIILSERQKLLAEAQEDLLGKEKELASHSLEHSDELKALIAGRREALASLKNSAIDEYDRIRTFHNAAAVSVRKNSCSGCFSKVPPQKVVEIRNHQDKIYFCEHCGRILFVPES